MQRRHTKTNEVLKLARHMGVRRIRDLNAHGVHPEYRNKVSLDVALEALRDCREQNPQP